MPVPDEHKPHEKPGDHNEINGLNLCSNRNKQPETKEIVSAVFLASPGKFHNLRTIPGSLDGIFDFVQHIHILDKFHFSAMKGEFRRGMLKIL